MSAILTRLGVLVANVDKSHNSYCCQKIREKFSFGSGHGRFWFLYSIILPYFVSIGQVISADLDRCYCCRV